MRSLLTRTADALDVALRLIAGGMLAVMVIVVAIQIVVRFALPPLGIVVAAPWTEELARYLLVWSMFLGAAAACRAGALIAVDALPDNLSVRWGLRVRLAAVAITIAFLLQLTWIGGRFVSFGWSETSTVLNVPMAYVYLAMPVGSAIATFNLFVLICEGRLLRLSGNHSTDPEEEVA